MTQSWLWGTQIAVKKNATLVLNRLMRIVSTISFIASVIYPRAYCLQFMGADFLKSTSLRICQILLPEVSKLSSTYAMLESRFIFYFVFFHFIFFDFRLHLTIATSTDKIFEKNSSFHVKQRNMGKVQFLFSRSLLLVLTKFSFREEDWTLGYTSMKF